MKLKQVVAGAAIGCALGTTGITLASGTANAAPGQCPPNVQCQGAPGGGNDGPPGGGNPGGQPPGNFNRGPEGGGPGGQPPRDFDRGPGGGRNGLPPGGPPPGEFNRGPADFDRPGDHDWRPPWNPQDNDWRGRFRGAPWGDDLPPWGWGAPPPPAWDGPLPPAWGPPPPPINYFGFNEQPVWDQGFNQWGFWFFGIWIPLPL